MLDSFSFHHVNQLSDSSYYYAIYPSFLSILVCSKNTLSPTLEVLVSLLLTLCDFQLDNNLSSTDFARMAIINSTSDMPDGVLGLGANRYTLKNFEATHLICQDLLTSTLFYRSHELLHLFIRFWVTWRGRNMLNREDMAKILQFFSNELCSVIRYYGI